MSEKLAVVVPTYNELRIERTLQALYDQRLREGVTHIIVDNGSTDDTRGCVEKFLREHDDFPLQIVEEAEKGTGAAADTGVRHAIESGCDVVARTDADTIPRFDWTRRIKNRFGSRPTMVLASGLILPIHDENYRRGDGMLMPIALLGARAALAVTHWDVRYLRSVTGGNMAIRSAAYENCGGFPRTRIDELDEDVALALRVYEEYGWRGINLDPGMVVSTSMRRVRAMGWVGTALHHLSSGRASSLRGSADIR